MRTTVTLDDDVERAVEALRQERGLGTSAAVNELARRGLAVADRAAAPFVQHTSPMGRPRLQLDDVSGVLDAIEGDGNRG